MLDNQTVVEVEEFHFPAGPAELSAVLYRPAGKPLAAVVLNGATGVPRDYYRHFARWLVEARGMACLTYDYRDFGTSLKGRLKDSPVTMSDWALIDMPAARFEMKRRFPDVPLWVIGHSVGGMLMPSQDGIEDVDRMIGVCSGLVHHTDHDWPYQGLARLFWFGHVPFLVKVLGYLPGKITGFGADLPPQVYWQWRKWCTSPRSYLPEAGLTIPAPDWGRSRAPVTMIALNDDDTIPPKCVWKLSELYGAGVEKKTLTPSDYGLKEVGHLGAFARRSRTLWPDLVPAL
ncbi:Alpha/beta hydrolase family protein [Falsiruegeria litorea R37]|uniref:Alpha/beta hydrolase family protein n=1 Tax=Falsiruegeria litorea R37 TaxID=1200284 RepID=A0A1Y5REQ0_9RHOB|nr:alpha/beta fold hydrolase [Falsiruegeria litorea]SLN15749.1 Alpha/beta hydrolase family protein [Falsiruegeria litorea R37]